MTSSHPQYGFNVTLDDLNFILKQIKLAEASVNPVTGAMQNLPGLVGSPLLPWGLRTVDGSWNNLLPGMERSGAADEIMPRLVPAEFMSAEGKPKYFYGPQDTQAGPITSYAQSTPGNVVFDSTPRLISNLIVDQSDRNPAAVKAAEDRAEISTYPGQDTVVDDNGTLYIPNLSPDIGLSPPFNGVMALFGQFFDHGLDLITKGGGTVFMPLDPQDPLYEPGGHTNFMVLSRAANTMLPGADGMPGTADDVRGHTNTTTPFIDQNQTYTSHPSHQVFLREYSMIDGEPVSTGKLLSGAFGEGNWGEVKAQAAAKLGIRLTDDDVFDVPLMATDPYGNILRGAKGFAQIVTSTGLVEGDPAANGGLGVTIPENTIRTGHQFLIDVAHSAAPGFYDHDHNPGTPKLKLQADIDTTPGSASASAPPGYYDNELLDRHFATGDGRGNENIGLTAIHSVFHSEHNRLVDQYKETILASGDLAMLNEWLAVDVTAIPSSASAIASLQWDGERLFQAGRFVNEMQYQHLVFEEFARAVQPSIDPFIFSHSADINPAIMEEFANVVYRFGHSMLTETVSRLDGDLNNEDIGLIQAFLNPVEFNREGGKEGEATAIADIIRGMSRQVGNEIDEFVTGALRNNLVGLPLDLAALNIARGRDTGEPSFNEARAAFYEMTGDAQLKPYTSWADFAPHLKNPASIINFIASYGKHGTITSESTLAGKRAAATLLVMNDIDISGDSEKEKAPEDRLDFLNGTGAWKGIETGLNDVDFWIGGLAEAKLEFGGMLAPTFNFVFEAQMEKLQNGDRFYYLSRTQGQNLLNELEQNLFSKMVMRNSDLGEAGTTTHLPALLFSTPSYILEMDQANQRTGIAVQGSSILNGDPTRNNDVLNAINSLVTRVAPGADVNGDGYADGGVLSYAYDGPDHVVLGGTQGNDTLTGGRGMDTLWGDGGNDRLDGGDEADQVHGGDGDDIITDHGTPSGAADFLRGDAGNDVISNGAGNDIVFGGTGQDFFIVGPDFTEIFAGEGNDFLLGGNGSDVLMGNEGDDWIEGGEGFDGLSGENSELFFNSAVIGHDVLNGQGNDTDYDGESGNDIMVQGPGIQRSNGMLGFDWGIHKGDPVGANSDLGIAIFNQQDQFILRDRFDSVEALSGWKYDDVLTGTIRPTGTAGEPGGILNGPLSDSKLLQKHVPLIAGFQQLLGVAAVADGEAVVFNPVNGADILIGGNGNDRFIGKAGDDLIDGDAWLNVRVSVRDRQNPDNEIRSVESINELKTDMLNGTINPGQLRIIREIITDASAKSDTDTAVYSDLYANYDLTRNADGTWTVAHLRGTLADGTDKIRNIELLQFADHLVNLTGEPTISDGTPLEGQVLTALPGTIALFSGIQESAIAFQWQSASGGAYADIAGATGATFTPTQAHVGMTLRVVAKFTDSAGLVRTVTSAPTKGIGDLVTGDNLANTLGGTANNDRLVGLNGNDTLNGGAGADEMIGGANNDAYTVDNTGDVVTELAGGGTDIIYTTLTSFALDELGNVENLQFIGSGNFTGRGTSAANMLTGGSGNDTLDGGAGADRLTGNVGDDTYVVSDVGDLVIEGLGAGNDTVNTSLATYTLANNVEILRYTGEGNFTGTGNASANLIVAGAGNDVLNGGNGNDELRSGAGNDRLNGGTGDDVLFGGIGDDTLDGGTGVDRMTGSNGDDTYVVDSVGDVITELLGEGDDTVRTTLANYVLAADLENLVYTGTQAFTGTGNAQNNRIAGGAGADILNGGAGIDHLTGGAGNDTYLVDESLDAVVELAGGGTDLVKTTLASYALFDHVENLTYTGNLDFFGEGNSLANVLTGSTGADTLDGKEGADTMAGSGGADIYIVDNTADVIIEAAGAGLDTVKASALAYTLGNHVDNLVFTGTGNFIGTGNNLANRITGGAGNDVLDGGTGTDTLIGGKGDDTYKVNHASDIVQEEEGEGIDTVQSTAPGYTLGLNLENLVQTGAAAVLTGNALDNFLSGGIGNDTLRGMDGNDRLDGGAGDDILMGQGGDDIFVFTQYAFGADTISGFDANPDGGQDLIDLSALGITAANFDAKVVMTTFGSDLSIQIVGGGTMTLQNVAGGSVTMADFILGG
ncbi:peroxidase family protein [Telluria aromaticivorans]|uniref:Heme peroxidase n=1 Tax=Telluria aromaticivorans TaxID=2725995 RepID=A0A7Y2K207_9BURK|nr:peroxidase family protein [Telluria aromaticivorans]NNG24693.1 heme peroxidase [Telluria aromaticivorans]